MQQTVVISHLILHSHMNNFSCTYQLLCIIHLNKRDSIIQVNKHPSPFSTPSISSMSRAGCFTFELTIGMIFGICNIGCLSRSRSGYKFT